MTTLGLKPIEIVSNDTLDELERIAVDITVARAHGDDERMDNCVRRIFAVVDKLKDDPYPDEEEE